MNAAVLSAPRALAAMRRSQPPPLPAGELIDGGRYVVVRLLGEGGMGEVYELRHTALGLRCALKVLHRKHVARRSLSARLRNEARSLASIRHANVVSAIDLGELADGRPYLVMELLSGRDLREELLRRGPLPAREALALVAQALEGLSALHAQGLVHRDVKLSNLFLCDDGAVKIIDLGTVTSCVPDASPESGVLLGTLRSMAPEQCSLGDVDERADVYAAGLALYELVAGRGPFDELCGSPDAMRFAHVELQPPSPSAFAPEPLPLAVEDAIARALAKAPPSRFASAAEMAAALRAVGRELGPHGAESDATPRISWLAPRAPREDDTTAGGSRAEAENLESKETARGRLATRPHDTTVDDGRAETDVLESSEAPCDGVTTGVFDAWDDTERLEDVLTAVVDSVSLDSVALDSVSLEFELAACG